MGLMDRPTGTRSPGLERVGSGEDGKEAAGEGPTLVTCEGLCPLALLAETSVEAGESAKGGLTAFRIGDVVDVDVLVAVP